MFTGEDLWLYTNDGKRKNIKPRGKDAFVAELQHAVDCVAEGRESEIISGRSAREALKVCLKEQQSVLTGKPVRISETR
ncbi:MAG: hypothetical protein HY318_03475 [Armatimonadetes bacterium]|nr:hypothetical protein [Armatimonadota bacterium]